jgi:phosphate starvation-inducible PhoH-like protein
MRKQTPTKPQKLRIDDLLTFEPITGAQENVYDAWEEGQHIVMTGTAGTGKTFTALYLALEDVLDKGTPELEKVVIIRSIVPTREIGFLPGTLEEKIDAYTGPYKSVCSQLFNDGEAWQKLTKEGVIEFMSTSFIRGETISNAVIVVDEMQNLTFHELDSVITRIGNDCRILFCGDYHQTDFHRNSDKNGILKFLNILEHMTKFEVVNFTWSDIVRSDFVRDYIMTKEMLGVTNE